MDVGIAYRRKLALDPFVLSNQRGVAAVEGAIVLLAFVTVAALLAYAVLSAGRVTTEATEAKVSEALSLPIPVLTFWGTVTGESDGDATTLDRLRFQMVNLYKGPNGVDVTKEDTVVTYIDEHQYVNLRQEDWGLTWLTGSGNVIEPGEKVEITVDLSGLDPPLGPSQHFKIQVNPKLGVGASLVKITPPQFTSVYDLP